MITEHRVSIDGVETSYCENGAGRPIVFLHGAGFGAEGKSLTHNVSEGYHGFAIRRVMS